MATSPIFKSRDGKYYVYLFPFLKTEVIFKNSEPYVEVFRGIRERLNFDGPDHSAFKGYIFTTLKPKVAVSYLDRTIRFDTPRHLTVMRMLLPLKKAYVAKRKKYSFGLDYGPDEYIPALANRSYIWWKWRAPIRRHEAELVWKIEELGTSLRDTRFEMARIEAPVHPVENTNDYYSHANWHAAKDQIAEAITAGLWVRESP